MLYLHSLDIIHRDLTLKNVLLNKFLFPKLCDFGLSIQISQKNEENEDIYGTPGYIAPESYRFAKYSKASDVYSFAILLFILLSRINPYEKLYPQNIMHEVAFRNNRPDKTEEIDANYWDLIKRCWSEDPKDRPTFNEIVDELVNEKFTKNVNVELFMKYVSFIKEQNKLPDNFEKFFLKKSKNSNDD